MTFASLFADTVKYAGLKWKVQSAALKIGLDRVPVRLYTRQS